MAIPVEMPKMSDTMEEGVLVSWTKEEGDEVSAGDVIAQVETDKATMDLEVYDDGVLLKKVIAEGDAVPIGSLIAVLGKKGEDVSGILSKYQGKQSSGEEIPAPPATPPPPPGARAEPVIGGEPTQAPEPNRTTDRGDGAAVQQPPQPAAAIPPGAEERIKASPLARRLAREHGIDLAVLQGSGPEGRIIRRDIEAQIGQQPAAQPAQPQRVAAPAQVPAEVSPTIPGEQYETIKLSQMRKAIARRLAQSKFTAPHFYLVIDVDMEKAADFRAQLNALAETQERPKVSVNDFITKACALALRQHPDVNASWLEQEGEIRRYHQVHVAVAVALPEGLITPIVHNADQKGLGQIADETRSLAERARNKQLQPSDYEGSTFTTSNLGMFGIEEFTAIINPPNSCILAIGTIRDEPVVKEGKVVPGKRMKLTLSCDHRIVDGATGARFLGTVKEYLEEPLNLLL
ncbi:MAG TPA: pyruvate dehydrogenase complex dihydrolipoamide acetyltransferase [Rhodothermales bacterium]|nr:pyruvate dehydrogenase complex dihydrolipoamide acetyltransferase [Rhodothermales bacterium]